MDHYKRDSATSWPRGPKATDETKARLDNINSLRIREKDVLRFLKNHPQEINLGKVDEVWFLDLVLLRGREVPEAKTSHVEEADENAVAA
jgi:hypothetical protein